MALRIETLPLRMGELGLAGAMRVARGLPDRAAVRLGLAVGRLAARAQPRGDRVRRHLRLAFGDELAEAELRRLAAGFYEHVGLTFFELMRLGSWSRERVLELTEVAGLEHAEAARAAGVGRVVLAGHLGNWELAAAAMAHRGYRPTVVMRLQRRTPLQEYLLRTRARHGIDLIPRNSLRGCFTCLQEDGNLTLLVDQRDRRGGLSVPFFGIPTTAPAGPAALALRSGAPVLLVTGHRLPEREWSADGVPRHRVHVVPVPVTRTGDRDRDLRENTARFQQAIETAIRRAPEQWIWTYRRWGLRPGGRVQPAGGRV